MRPFLALPLSLLLPSAFAAPVPKAKAHEVELMLLATELVVGDRFDALVRFTNRTEEDVILFREPDLQQRVANVVLEVKGPGDKAFRRPYKDEYGLLSSDGTSRPEKEPVKARDTRCEFVTLPWTQSAKVEPVFERAGEWRVRAKVVLRAGEEKLSAEAVVAVSERTAEEAKRFAEARGKMARLNSPTMTTFGTEFQAHQKLNDELGACYLAEVNRRWYLEFRLRVAGTDRSNESADAVMRDIEAYLKTATAPVRDHLCCSIARTMIDETDRKRRPQALVIGRKFLDRVDCLPDDKKILLHLYAEEEKALKASPPDKKK
jgi:hypothetical protein